MAPFFNLLMSTGVKGTWPLGLIQMVETDTPLNYSTYMG